MTERTKNQHPVYNQLENFMCHDKKNHPTHLNLPLPKESSVAVELSHIVAYYTRTVKINKFFLNSRTEFMLPQKSGNSFDSVLKHEISYTYFCFDCSLLE